MVLLAAISRLIKGMVPKKVWKCSWWSSDVHDFERVKGRQKWSKSEREKTQEGNLRARVPICKIIKALSGVAKQSSTVPCSRFASKGTKHCEYLVIYHLPSLCHTYYTWFVCGFASARLFCSSVSKKMCLFQCRFPACQCRGGYEYTYCTHSSRPIPSLTSIGVHMTTVECDILEFDSRNVPTNTKCDDFLFQNNSRLQRVWSQQDNLCVSSCVVWCNVMLVPIENWCNSVIVHKIGRHFGTEESFSRWPTAIRH